MSMQRRRYKTMLLLLACAVSSTALAVGMDNGMGADGYITGTPPVQDATAPSGLWDARAEHDKRMQKCRRCDNCATKSCRTQCWRRYCRE